VIAAQHHRKVMRAASPQRRFGQAWHESVYRIHLAGTASQVALPGLSIFIDDRFAYLHGTARRC
jgi:hypothetical protein